VAEGPIESFHKGILIRFARLNIPQGDSSACAPGGKAVGEKFRAIVEPNGFATDWGGASAIHTQPMKEYEHVKEAFRAGLTDDAFGVPEATVNAVLKLVDAPNPPLRLFLGKVALPWIKQVYEERLATWHEWQEVAVAAHGK